MNCFTNFIDILPPIDKFQSYIETIFYLTTTVVAWKGLSIWKAEKKSSVEYELSKKVLTSSYRIRDAIISVCSPFMSGAEYSDRTPVRGESIQEKRAHEAYYAYRKRLDIAYQEQALLYPYMIEAETILGDKAKEAIETLLKSLATLRAAIETYFRVMAKNAENLDDKSHLQRHNIIYGTNNITSPGLPADEIDDNGFRAGLDSAVEKIKITFSPYIVNFHPELKKSKKSDLKSKGAEERDGV